MKIKKMFKGVVALAVLGVMTGCGASLSGVRSDLGIPDPDMKALSEATTASNSAPHKISALLEFAEQLYGAEEYYKAYDRWAYILKLEAENQDAKEKIDRGIISISYKLFPEMKSEADFSSKWNNQSWRVDLKRELDSTIYAKMSAKAHLPLDVVKNKTTEISFEMKKMTVNELGTEYNGYVAYIVKRMPFFDQKELFRVLKIEENMRNKKFYEAAKAVHDIPIYFPHAKFEAEKLEVTVRDQWSADLRQKKSMTFDYYTENKEALFSFIRFYDGTKDAENLKVFIEEMLYNYFNSTSVTDMESAVEYWNNSQKFSQEFRNSKYRDQVLKGVKDKWSRYIKNSASVIISSPQRTKNEIFAFRSAFEGSDQALVKNVEKELDMSMLKRYSNLSIVDTADINNAYAVLSNYYATFPTSTGYVSLNKDLQQKISEYILACKIYDGSTLKEATDLFVQFKTNMPTSGYVSTLNQFISVKTDELHAESMKYYELAKESKEKNQYTLAARYIQKSLELEPDNVDAKALSDSMSEYMEAIGAFNSVITEANDAETYDKAMEILNNFISKYSKYSELTSEIKTERKRLARYKKNWNKRAKNSFK